MVNFNGTPQERAQSLSHLMKRLENLYNNPESIKVTPNLDVDKISEAAQKIDFSSPVSSIDAINTVIDGLSNYMVQVTNPNYYGLYNPRPNIASIIADIISAFMNPQMAAWSHAPYAVEIENHLIREVGHRFGYDEVDGVFAARGAEANLTAVLCAINHRYEQVARDGMFGLTKRPIIYCSAESHHSINKAAKTVGLGYNSVKMIAVTNDLKMDTQLLQKQIQADISAGLDPCMIIGTAATTGTGTFDPLAELADIAKQYDLWYHVDAAYGGAAILHPNLVPYLSGTERSDSITFDAHKKMSVPMGTSLFISSNTEILHKTFRISAEYMPKEGANLAITDPFTHSLQWSRRFIGLKLYMSLAVFGWQGYQEIIGHQCDMGDHMRAGLMGSGWIIENDTPLPVICFTHSALNDEQHVILLQEVLKTGTTWISQYPVHGRTTLRACITNYDTQAHHVDRIIDLVNYVKHELIK